MAFVMQLSTVQKSILLLQTWFFLGEIIAYCKHIFCVVIAKTDYTGRTLKETEKYKCVVVVTQ